MKTTDGSEEKHQQTVNTSIFKSALVQVYTKREGGREEKREMVRLLTEWMLGEIHPPMSVEI